MRGQLIITIQNKTNCFEYSTENQEKEDKPKKEEAAAKEPVAEEKPKTRASQPKGAAPTFMLSIFAFLDVFVTKLLVSPHITYAFF